LLPYQIYWGHNQYSIYWGHNQYSAARAAARLAQ
jgi:hypothetical protein